MQPIQGEGYLVEFDPDGDRVRMAGSLRLGGLSEYAPISDLLDQAIDGRETCILDLRALEFLNSSGIATLSKFVIHVRNSKTCKLTVLGSNAIPWQGKSLNNLKRLMPSLELVFDA